ncbi:MAG TPA: hypothetical protein VGT44_09080 [Ktedonobacteraceae bacterium]|nr:hypothetical protein [Ktedonobacteraceae bacterium]
MHDTLLPLIERALAENTRPLEFYLREQSHLPGTRANLGLVGEVSDELASMVARHSQQVWELLRTLSQDALVVESNTPAEFVALCGAVAFGACAAAHPDWQPDVRVLLSRMSSSASWRVREGVAMAYQRLLTVAPEATLVYLRDLAADGDCLQQRACVAAVAEPILLQTEQMKEGALGIQGVIVHRFHDIPLSERKREDVRILRQGLSFTLSVAVAALPEAGFTLLRECASWGDPDINWIIRENLKKKRLLKFTEYSAHLASMLA